ncbi:MAG: hypothetical protein JWQ89_3156 [Devosia sp.]|uniref:hypothetical protein n=1 Tax=Devosia sp. TaxID=1871048 RepID=UPI00262145DA|nr:hypothetical protein [Devosia sp.]MDB5541429.1 hypothetical protein [Devosia sp.]
MNAFGELWRAVIGWLDLLTGRPAEEKFNLGPTGLVNSTGFYFAVVLLLIAVESSLSGFPGWTPVILSLIVNATRLMTVWLMIWISARVLAAPAIAMAVPSTYAMAFILAVSLPLAYLAGSNLLVSTLGVLGFMLFRVARGIGKLRIGISIAFAILCIVALVAVRVGLYMLTTGGQGIG